MKLHLAGIIPVANLKTDFNFLTVAQWGPRKNLENTIKHFSMCTLKGEV